MKPSRDQVLRQIEAAFANAKVPEKLSDSSEGVEPELVEKAFRDKPDWRELPSPFLDEAPEGFGSALSFFSDAAYRYYLPAYLLAELRDELHNVDVWYHLTHGLGYDRDVKINPSRYGDATWWDRATARHAEWTDAQRQAVIAALELRAASDSIDAEEVRAALDCYWRVTPPPIGRPVIDRP